MVPSARLELAQLSPLPPQDSVSTNSTTTACLFGFPVCRTPYPLFKGRAALRKTLAFYLEKLPHRGNLKRFARLYLLAGIRSAPCAGAAGAGALAAGAAGATAAFSKTLPTLVGRALPK